MKAYMVQGSYGKFGLTAAMFRRCSEFIKRDVQCTSITLDFTENLYDFIDNRSQNTQIPSKLTMANPYLELSEQADHWYQQVGDQAKFAVLSQIDHIFGEIASYYHPTGRKLGENDAELLSQCTVSQLWTYQGIVIHKTVEYPDKTKKEYIYSRQGLCIVIRDFDANNKQTACLVFDYTLGIIHNYKGSYRWNVEYIDRLITQGCSSISPRPLLICDGPGSARKITEISKSKAIRVYVLHNNHKHNNGKLTERDSWNLNHAHLFDYIVPLTEQHRMDVMMDFVGNSNFVTIPNFTSITQNISDKHISTQPFSLILVGQLIERKGIADTLKTYELLRKKYCIPAKLDIYGVHPKGEEETQKVIAQYLQQLPEDLRNDVTFHGYTHHAAEKMAAATCMLFPSKSEALPLTILESMSVGTPVIAYDCKYGPKSMIDDEKNGYLVKIGDYQNMAKYAAKLLQDPYLRNNFSVAAKEKALQITDAEKIFASWKALMSD